MSSRSSGKGSVQAGGKAGRKRRERYPEPGVDMTLSGMRRRLQRHRGPAKGYTCAACGLRAALGWSYDQADPDELTDPYTGRAYSEDIAHYRPLCWSCHRRAAYGSDRFDRDAAVALYRQGATVQGVARHHGVTVKTVRALLVERGVPVRGPAPGRSGTGRRTVPGQLPLAGLPPPLTQEESLARRGLTRGLPG